MAINPEAQKISIYPEAQKMSINSEAQKIDTVEFSLIETENSNPFPNWCNPNPKLSVEQLEILEKSWNLILSGENQGFRQFISEGGFLQRRVSHAKFSPRGSRNLSAVLIPYNPVANNLGNQTPSPVENHNTPNLWPNHSLKPPSDENKYEHQIKTENFPTRFDNLKNNTLKNDNQIASVKPENIDNSNPIKSNLKISIEPQLPFLPNQVPDNKQNEHNGNELRTNSPTFEPGSLEHNMQLEKTDHIKCSCSNSSSPQINGRISPTSKVNADAIQFFYDTYFDQLKNHPLLQIKSADDIKSKIDSLLRLCKFLVNFSGKFGTLEYINTLKEIIHDYNKHHINASEHDYLGQALLFSIKIVLGSQCSARILEAWKLVYSEFLRVGLQYVTCSKTLFIKKRESIEKQLPEPPILFLASQKNQLSVNGNHEINNKSSVNIINRNLNSEKRDDKHRAHQKNLQTIVNKNDEKSKKLWRCWPKI